MREESRVLKSLKKVVNSLCANVRSEAPIISLMECIDSCGMPRSTALIPVFCDMLQCVVEGSRVERNVM